MVLMVTIHSCHNNDYILAEGRVLSWDKVEEVVGDSPLITRS